MNIFNTVLGIHIDRWGVHVRQKINRLHHVGVVDAGDEGAGLDAVQLVTGVDVLGEGGMVG